MEGLFLVLRVCLFYLCDDRTSEDPFKCFLEGIRNAGDEGSISGSGRSPRERNNPLQYSFPGKSHAQRSLVGYSPWGRKESDVTV